MLILTGQNISLGFYSFIVECTWFLPVFLVIIYSSSSFVDCLQDERNFLRDPPSGVQFIYDYDSMFPVALATLEEDPELKKMRFNLVPKK